MFGTVFPDYNSSSRMRERGIDILAETEANQLRAYNFWAKLPKIVGWTAVAIAVASLLVAFFLIFRSRTQPEFRMKGFPTELSKDLVADVSGYERTEFDAGTRKYYIKADRARTFSDNHQELETVFIEVFDPQNPERSDKIKAEKAVYIPQENKNFIAYLAGNVKIVSRDDLVIDGDQVTYSKADDTAAIDEPLKFHRYNISGRADRARALITAKKIELISNVEVLQYPNADFSGEPKTRLNSGYASYDQSSEKIELGEGVRVFSKGDSGSGTTLESVNAMIQLRIAGENRELAFAEAKNNVRIESVATDQTKTIITASTASYDKPADKFDLSGGIKIQTGDNNKPTEIEANSAFYDQKALHLELLGGAGIVQPDVSVRGEKISANLYPQRKLKDAKVTGNAYAMQSEAERTVEITASELSVAYSTRFLLSAASASSNAEAVLTPKENVKDYSRASLRANRRIDVYFRNDGSTEKMITEGRTTLQMDAPSGRPDGANKKVTANILRTFFSSDGKNLSRAEAEGDAELVVEPVQKTPENYKTTVSAPRFECSFYLSGNNARQCDASAPTKTVRIPLIPTEGRGQQVLTAETLSATFVESTRDLDVIEAAGGTKFSELDRNGTANRISFTNSDGIVRLRDGEPTIWDSRARTKAREIDWDTRSQRSYLRTNVSATYYSPERASGSVPFAATGKPVFVTSDKAEIDHRAEIAVFSGNARGWQENNYVRAHSLTINQKEGRFDAEGDVQSLLYDVKRTENGKTTSVPVSAAAAGMTYYREKRLLHYEGNVDVRQGSDRITSQTADIYLTDRNEIERSEFNGAVSITQPGRKASADYALYNAEKEFVILRGRPARVSDAVQGSSEGREIQMDLRSNRVVNEGRSKDNSSGRTRSVYKMKVN